MQNTRLNTAIDVVLNQANQWLQNPWRRISLLVISLLLGNFLATALATIAGQAASWDIFVALVLVFFSEAISWLVYGSRLGRAPTPGDRRPVVVEMLNGLKLGLMYGLFIEAFKLGS